MPTWQSDISGKQQPPAQRRKAIFNDVTNEELRKMRAREKHNKKAAASTAITKLMAKDDMKDSAMSKHIEAAKLIREKTGITDPEEIIEKSENRGNEGGAG